MKNLFRITILSSIAVASLTNTYAQKCKFQKQEDDPFGGGKVLHSQSISMLPLMSESHFDLQIQRNGEEYVIYVNASITSGDPLAFSVHEGQQLLFLLENKDTVQIFANSTLVGKQPVINQGMSSLAAKSYVGKLYNYYGISLTQLEKLKSSPMEIIRFYFTASDNRELKVDRSKITQGAKIKFPEAINCMLNN